MKEEKSKHAELQNTAIRWLYNLGCSVFAQEVPTKNGICYWLIKQCTDTNAETMTIKQSGVNHLGKQLGDWEIVVRRISSPAD